VVSWSRLFFTDEAPPQLECLVGRYPQIRTAMGQRDCWQWSLSVVPEIAETLRPVLSVPIAEDPGTEVPKILD
jgi:hypothetical protein